MRIELKPDTVDRLEEITGQKLTTRCDKVINKALDQIGKNKGDSYERSIKISPRILEVIQNE